MHSVKLYNNRLSEKDMKMEIKEINELLTKVFQQKCCLEDGLKSFYQLKFPSVLSITEFEEFKDNCERFLSQYDIKTGASTILYPKGVSKVFVLQINKLPMDKFLEKLTALSKDSQLYEAVNKASVLNVKMLLDKGANFNKKNIVGDTLLHIAIKRDHISSEYIAIVSLLLEQGVSIQVMNSKGETPLQIVDQKKDILLGKKLIEALLYQELETKRPDFSMQELHHCWDEQFRKLTEKFDTQTTQREEAVEKTEIAQALQLRKSIHFFSSQHLLNEVKHLEESSTVANLGK